eukprot:3933846-Rhodomonas_salina.1
MSGNMPSEGVRVRVRVRVVAACAKRESACCGSGPWTWQACETHCERHHTTSHHITARDVSLSPCGMRCLVFRDLGGFGRRDRFGSWALWHRFGSCCGIRSGQA